MSQRNVAGPESGGGGAPQDAPQQAQQPAAAGGEEQSPPPLPPAAAIPKVGFVKAPAAAGTSRRTAVLIKACEEIRATAGPEFAASSPKIGYELVVEKLVSGGVFRKHTINQRGHVAHFRYAWCSADLRVLQWGDLERTAVSKSFPTAELKAVELGCSTDVMRALRERDAVKEDLCLSLVWPQRTLDLECTNTSDRDMWYIAFSHLLAFSRLPAEEQRGSQTVLSTARKNLRGFAPGTMAAEMETLKDQLAESQQRCSRIQAALQAVRGDTTGEELIHPRVYHDKAQEEATRLRQGLSSAKAECSFLRDENKRLKQEVERLTGEVTFLKALQEADMGEQQLAERREFEAQKARLKRELDLAAVRETIKTTSDREGFVAAATSCETIEVPVAALPVPAPEDEHSSSDDEVDGRGGAVAPGVTPAERAARQRRKALSDLFSCRVHINERAVAVPSSEDRVDHVTDRLVAELVRAYQGGALQPAQAKAVVEALLRGVSETQLAGDAYGAVSWVAGHPELVLIAPDRAHRPSLFFQADEAGLLLLSRHEFRVSGARDLQGATSSDDAAQVWVYCSAAYTKKVGFDREELLDPRVLLSFHSGRLKPAAEAGAAGGDHAARPALASSLLTRRMHEEAKHLSEEDLHKVRTREREKVAEANAAAAKGGAAAGSGLLHMVSNDWLSAWKKFLAGDPRPGPIDNACLLEADLVTPKPNLRPGKDYRALPEPLWNVLLDMYGGGPDIPRSGASIYASASGAEGL